MHLIVPSPKGADLRAPFLVQIFDFWDIFWATINEKSLTECSVRDVCREDGFVRPAAVHISVCP